MTLIEYLKSTGTTYEALGDAIGRSKSEVWRWAHKQRVPDINTAMSIERATNGAVTLHDFASEAAA